MRGIGIVEILYAGERRFRDHNQKRIRYLSGRLRGKKSDIFELIPFLLHEDNINLIGNMHGGIPCGIACFAYTQSLKDCIARYFPKFQSFDKLRPLCAIDFIALIGSAGTVAFTEESDLDYWVGMETGKQAPDALQRFREKLSIIENWAMKTAGLEVHIFIIDPVQIHDNNFGTLTKESCGSALGSLLKDEFYRTGILCAGKMPLYWIVPSGTQDTEYSTYAEFARSGKVGVWIDLGNIGSLSASEYFGAALWQILKGLGSPFKSTLKMAQIDMYSAEQPQSTPLCDLYKKEVAAVGETAMCDPYLFLVDALRAFYDRQGLPAVKTLLERCFLVRILISLEIGAVADENRLHAFLEITKRWAWAWADVEALSSVKAWESGKNEEFRKQILEFLIESYKRIRERTRDAPVKITGRDMTIVGKKLKSFFEQSPGKVPYEFSFFNSKDVSRIEIEEQQTLDLKSQWVVRLCIGSVDKPLFHMVRPVINPLVACAWCGMNNFFNGEQQLLVRGRTALVDNAKTIMQTLAAFFANTESEELLVEDLLNHTTITHLYLMPNWDDPEWNQYTKSVFVFYRNSLGEIFYESFTGKQCVEAVLNEMCLKKIGLAHLYALKWKVSILTGKVSSTRRVSDQLSRTMEDFIAKQLSPRRKHGA
jgi:adenylate cyclase class 1